MNESTTLIDGVWRHLTDRKSVFNPATGAVVGTVCWGGAAEAAEADAAAADAFHSWSQTSARARADLLLAGADAISAAADSLGALLAAETGKRLPEAVGEVRGSAEYFRWFAEEARRPMGTVMTPDVPGRRQFTVRRPAGVVVSLTAWNFPCSLQARKVGAALAAGCTVVARVSERAPLAVTEMFRLLQGVGLPHGVLNLVHGPGRETTDALLAHPAVRVVTFTGSTAVGRQIMRSAAARVVRPLLELGGDAPFVACADADVDRAVDAAYVAKLRNTGQSCIAANRFIVHRDIVDEFTSKLAARFDAATVGDGCADPVPDVGAMIDATAAGACLDMVRDALDRGAVEATTPREVPASGAFVRPMLFTGVPDNALLATAEVFGPVAAVFPFEVDTEAIARANATEMGLAAYVFSSDADRCWRMAENLDAGIVGVNEPVPSTAISPMGGLKQSGLGREGSSVGLEEFTETKYVAWRVAR